MRVPYYIINTPTICGVSSVLVRSQQKRYNLALMASFRAIRFFTTRQLAEVDKKI